MLVRCGSSRVSMTVVLPKSFLGEQGSYYMNFKHLAFLRMLYCTMEAGRHVAQG